MRQMPMNPRNELLQLVLITRQFMAEMANRLRKEKLAPAEEANLIWMIEVMDYTLKLVSHMEEGVAIPRYHTLSDRLLNKDKEDSEGDKGPA